MCIMQTERQFMLANRKTGLFFQNFEVWTEDPDLARKFATASLAYEFAQLYSIRDIKVASTNKNAAIVI